MLLIILLALITILAALMQGLSFRRMCQYVEKELKLTPGNYSPAAAVILPCKGLDPGFARNIEKLLSQEYGNAVEFIFSVASEADPAYPVLKKFCETNSKVQTKLVVAGINPACSQKINNQLHALNHISDHAEVIVFVDSDVIARNDFLRYLVNHLQDPTVGVTTGYRFYIPIKGSAMSLLRALWNRISAWELANPRYAFAWGGAMAVRKETFIALKVAETWSRAADDDLSLTKVIKQSGLQVRFVPQCLVASEGDGSIKEIIEWTNRQLILTKVYYPELWLRALARASLLVFWLIAVLSSFVAWAAGNCHSLPAGLVGLSLLPVEAYFLYVGQKLWYRVLTYGQGHTHLKMQRDKLLDHHRLYELEGRSLIEAGFSQSIWQWALILPLAHIVLPWMTLYSLLTNKIKWRGVTYLLRSPTDTVIVGG